MNSFERIIATIKGEETDRKAFTATLSQYGSKYCAASNQEYYQDPEVYSKGQIAISEKFGTDVLFGPFALALIGKAFGAELKFYADRPPMFRKPFIQSVDELLNFPYPDIQSDPAILYLRDSIKILSSHFNQKVPVSAVSLNPVDMPIMIFGMDKWLEIFLLDRNGFYRTMEYIIPFFIDLTNALINDGAACVSMPTVFANSGLVTRKQTAEIVNPILKSAFSKINGGIIMHHGGVPFLPYFDTYKDFPDNVIGFGMDWTDDYREARNIIGENRVLLFGIDGPSLYLKGARDVVDNCRKILESTKSDNRHILFSCSSDILCNTPEENILAMKEAVCQFSQ